MSRHALLMTFLVAGAVGGCAAPSAVEDFTRVEVASDRATYDLRRIGVLPFGGRDVDGETAALLAETFAAALAGKAQGELRLLTAADLDAIPRSATFERGYTRPETVLALGRRFGLDALIVGDVRRLQWFAPQRLELSLDLLAVETGVPVWHASVELDTGDERVQRALKDWVEHDRSGVADGSRAWQLYLISPRFLAEFAAELVAARW